MEIKSMKTYNYKYFLSKKFKNWDSNKFDWKNYSYCLARYCFEYFDIWWDSDRYDWKYDSHYLARYCCEYFKIWWNFDRYNWKNNSDYLSKYCFKYKSIWKKDYMIWKLSQ